MTPQLSDFINSSAAWAHVREAKQYRNVAARYSAKNQPFPAQLLRIEMRAHARRAVIAARHECRARIAAFTV